MKKRILCSVAALALAVSMAGCWWDKPASSSGSSSMSGSMSGSTGGSSGMMDDSSMMDGSSGMTDGSSMMDGSDSSMSGSGDMAGSGAASGSSSAHSGSSSKAAAANAAALPWQLRLVNAQNALPEDFTVETAEIKGYDSREFDARAAAELEAMLDAAEKDGCKLYLVSAYRSVKRQKALYERKINFYKNQGHPADEAAKLAAEWVAAPGTSEHNLGLAADIVGSDWYSSHDDLTEEFEQTPHFAWLSRHAAEYGFVLRYPKGKEEYTGVHYEPWHYRYVGAEYAAAMGAAGQCLEEYIAAL